MKEEKCPFDFKQLPRYRAAEPIWEKIEEELDSNATEINRVVLKNAIAQLPHYHVNAFNWDKIDKKLSGNSSIVRLYLLKMAAAITVIVCLSSLIVLFLTKSKSNESIIYSQETIANNETELRVPNYEDEIKILVEEQCRTQPDVCKSSHFIELTQQLLELNKSLEQLKIIYKTADKDIETYQYMLRIQKEKGKVSKKIIQYINS